MNRADQEKLCALLNAEPNFGEVEWRPDPGAIGGGIEGLVRGRRYFRASRQFGRIVLRIGYSNDTRMRTFRTDTPSGRGWREKYAAEIIKVLPDFVPPEAA